MQAAERILIQSCGINMNTWVVGNQPVGHHSITYRDNVGKHVQIPANRFVSTSKPLDREEFGQKVFFMKVRIMAGQANLEGNPYGYTDFKWLTKDELKAELAPEYYHCVRSMIADR